MILKINIKINPRDNMENNMEDNIEDNIEDNMENKFNLSDFHLHTEFSFDSNEKIDVVCESAVMRGLSAIAVTNHYDHDGIEDGIYPPYLLEKDVEDMLRAKEKYKGKLSVYVGLEIGQPHLMTDKKISHIESLGYEFIIGSLHNLENSFDFYFLDYKKTPPEYDVGVYKKYLRELLRVADCGFVDTIGHITYPERYMKEAGKNFDYSVYHEDFARLFEKIAQNNLALEINTSGLRQGVGHTVPKIELLELFGKCGGKKITIGSDAHFACHVGEGVAEAFGKARKMGFYHINEIRRK
jgi:histidinol-phosphatase (PHP family)